MTDWFAILLVAHVSAAIFMAAPLYMLIIVNERARLGAPLGLPHDAYLENIVRQQPARCYPYLAILALTGVAITLLRDGAGALVEPTLLLKIAAAATLLGILSYVHVRLQPRIDRLVAALVPGAAAPPETVRAVAALRARRKRLAATCLFLVLVAAIFGVRLIVEFSLPVAAVALLAAAGFSWRAFRTGVRYGIA